jgi:phytoene dehydrogenase-like protein
MEKRVAELGGVIKSETRIIEIDPDQRQLKDDKDVSYQYDHLVWAADLKTLYNMLDTESLLPEVRTRIKNKKNKIMSSRGGDSVYTLFLEVDEPVESFQKIAHGHFFYTPSRQGLGKTRTDELKHLLADFDKIKKEDILAWLDKLTRLNTYEISIPGMKYPESSPSGKTGLIISFLADYDIFDKIRKAGWYDEFISEIEDRVLDVISGSIFPMLKDNILRRFSFTPLDIEKRVGSSEGAITGWSFENPVPVINKIQFSRRSVLTPIPHILQAGQWAYSPAGVPMAVLTGKLAADKIIKKSR